jgi:DNA-binding NtrC family response regulator
MLQDIKQFAKYDAPVLLTGETGTGKELVAWAIHNQSNRQEHAFIPVNCGAIPDNLFENEFFGHVKGAYTDAGLTQQGLVEQAESGCLFLDEVDSLSAKAQVALLRFLQDQEFRPLGGRQFRKANVRIVAATNTDLTAKVANGEFRSDLYYRLNILQLNLPSLLQRMQDIPLLCNYFLEKFYRQYGGERRQFSLATLNWMMQQPWPGNIRELENFILRAYLANDGTLVTHDRTDNDRAECLNNHLLLNMDWDTDGQFANAKTHVVEEFEKTYLDWILRKTKGNVSDAAKQAGKERRSLGKLLKKYAINKAKYYS